MTAEPHPQRCETCTKQSCHFHPNNNYWKVTPHIMAVIGAIDIVGCASHSSAESEQEIREIIEVLASTEGFVPTAIRSDVMRLRERLQTELRSKQGEQP